MANVSSQPKRSIAGAKWYFTNNAKKRAEHREYVDIGAANGAMVGTFFFQMEQNHKRFGKDVYIPAFTRDANGQLVPKLDKLGRHVHEPKFVQYYSLVQGFGLDELDPDDPESWTRAQELGQALGQEVSRQAAQAKIVGGKVVDDPESVARPDGHMVLVVTEIGSNGKLHNHVLVDAVNRFTGKQLNSSFVTHHRLAPTHDKVLAVNGFQQRIDMVELAAEVEARQGAGEKGWSYRQVATQTRETPDKLEDRQDLRHAQWAEDAAIAAHQGLPLPVEPFAIGELKRRAGAALADPRATSWDELKTVAREHNVTIDKRGKDVTIGMVRQQADGSFAPPTTADRRRGSKLGDDYSQEAVEATLGRHRARDNAKSNAEITRRLDDWRTSGAYDAEFERLRAEREAAEARRSTPARTEPAPVPEPVQQPAMEQPVRSGLRGLTVKPGPRQEIHQRNLQCMAEFDETWAERLRNGETPGAEFEREATKFGINRKLLDSDLGQCFDPSVRERLELRENAKDVRKSLVRGLNTSPDDDAYRVNLARHQRTNELIDKGDYEKAVEMKPYKRETRSVTESMFHEIKEAEARDQGLDGMGR